MGSLISIEKFWGRMQMNRADGCWVWEGSRAGGQRLTNDGKGAYGTLTIGSRSDGTRRQVYAHRLAYELVFGKIPKGQVIRHKCDNPLCCNPAHLTIGTQADNVKDAMARDRIAKGEQVHSSKLTARDIPKIRSRLQSGDFHHAIAADFGVSRVAITRISLGETWAWL